MAKVEIREARQGGLSDGDMCGNGQQMIEFYVSEAKGRGLLHVQLIFHAKRRYAHRFYECLGFKLSHLGFKMALK
ncbi:hypothetical protein SAMN02927900_00034 [Rhizobium mongolense subsp. loessense]|uniref:Uncharacterized protein n=1 Tax=Rhizobium mongolense subsp. loessense TaxID=158890 RepID=A0A1G4P6E6_9HYPH|nr:hypothetical protein SAMN02927900_00034 [Rhizobium mongolense subsp. loessense]